jgi:hypothetical protein
LAAFELAVAVPMKAQVSLLKVMPAGSEVWPLVIAQLSIGPPE